MASTARPRTQSSPPQIELIYELLDAHDDTIRIVADADLGPTYEAHLQYLRDLQRTGREVLARITQCEEL